MKKGKIIQVVEFTGEIELLKYRLENFPEVDEFIVIGSIPNDIKNVTHLDSDDDGTYKKLTEYLLKTCKNFEDIIIISNDNEFCDFSNFDFVFKEINYGSFFVRHLNFWWGRNYVSNKSSTNSFIFSFSQIVKDERLISRRIKTKGTDSSYSRDYLSNGWCFNGFFNTNDDEIYKKNLLPRIPLLSKLEKLKEGTPLPKNFHLLPEYQSNFSEKFLITFDDYENFDEQEYSKIVKIKFTEDNSEIYYKTDDFKYFYFEVKLPNRVLYGDKSYDDFISEFREMEIKKIIDLVRVTNEDIVEIKNPS